MASFSFRLFLSLPSHFLILCVTTKLRFSYYENIFFTYYIFSKNCFGKIIFSVDDNYIDKYLLKKKVLAFNLLEFLLIKESITKKQ